jgi:hypothetical protein
MEYFSLYNHCLPADGGEDTGYIIIDSSSSSDEGLPEAKKPKEASPTELNDSERTFRQWDRDRAANPVPFEDEPLAEDATIYVEDEPLAEDATIYVEDEPLAEEPELMYVEDEARAGEPELMYVEDEARAGEPEPMYTKGGNGNSPIEEEVSSFDLDGGVKIFTPIAPRKKQKKLTKEQKQIRTRHVEEAQKLLVEIARYELPPEVEALKKSFEMYKNNINVWIDLSRSVVEVCPEFKEKWPDDFVSDSFTDDVWDVLLDSRNLYPDMDLNEYKFKLYRFTFAVVAYCSKKYGTQAERVLWQMFQFVVLCGITWRNQALIDMFEDIGPK